MIFVSDLFNMQNVLCPEWLSLKPLEDHWQNSEYAVENGVHKWTCVNDFGDNLVIRFDGLIYRFGFYSDGEFNLLTEITEEYCLEV